MPPQRKFLPFAEWVPDQPPYGGQQATIAKNVIPIARGYRGFPAFLTYLVSALPAPVIGAYAVLDSLGNPCTFAGTVGTIYALVAGSWAEKNPTGVTYTGTSWDFAQFGDAVYAVNGVEGLQSSDVSGGTIDDFASVSGAPVASRVGVFGNFLVLGNLSTNHGAIHWSAIEDPTSWPTLGTSAAAAVQSDIQVFPNSGTVQALVGGLPGIDGIVFLERGIYRAMYVGPPLVFQFNVIDSHKGTIAPRSPVTCEGLVSFLARDGWYVTDGQNIKAVGANKIDQWFFDTVSQDRITEVRGAYDFTNRVAIWTFPSTSCPAGRHDKTLVYSPTLDRWSYGEIDTEFIFQDYSIGITLEQLNLYGGLDSLQFSLDSSALKGGVLGLSVFNPSHIIGGFHGDNLEAILETSEMGGDMAMVHGVRPVVDGGSHDGRPGVVAPVAPTCSIVHRNIIGYDTETIDCGSVSTFDGVAYSHISTRYFRAQVKLASHMQWKYAVGAELIFEPEGSM